MILPTAYQNAREAAQVGIADSAPIARRNGGRNSQNMAFGQTRVRACNSIFRYPSPCGCSESVPSGTPAFFLESRVTLRRRQKVAQTTLVRAFRFSCRQKTAICSKEADKSRKGGQTWKTSKSRFFAAQWCWGFQPVATRSRNKRSSVLAQVSLPQQCLTAACWPVRPLARPATSFTASKTPASADTLISRGAFGRSNRVHKAIVSRPGVGGFFVSKSLRIVAGQDQEGT